MGSTRTMRRARVAVPLAAAFGLAFAVAAPASASPAAVARTGSQIQYSASAGTANTAVFSSSGGLLQVSDSAGLLPGPGCTAVNPTTVTCGAAASVTAVNGYGADGNDSLGAATLSVPVSLNGGPGQDTVQGGGGNDRLTDPDGRTAAPATASFSGGGGNDQIASRNGGFDQVDCGPGFDVVVADPAALDAVLNCEVVLR
ncbi:hypothetical protein [Kitasatospora sp. NPDC057223]|uniref:hypothetical protein n=1 Tax=Kitasatospora sp. NPDC057223 TaxID=3346055 RepID=UPI003633395E